jgi:hypothetical protein
MRLLFRFVAIIILSGLSFAQSEENPSEREPGGGKVFPKSLLHWRRLRGVMANSVQLR